MTPHLTVAERRARLVRRHHLARTAATVSDAVAGVVALHSSDPASPYLAARARVGGFTLGDLDQELFEDRTLWRMHAMRRTLFIVALRDAAVFDAAAGRAVAEQERHRLEQWVAAEGDPSNVAHWLRRLETGVMDVLAKRAECRTSELAAAVPELNTQITVGSGKWSGQVPLSSRLLYLMAMDGAIVRTRPAGTWRSSQYHWAKTATWFTAVPDPQHPEAGRTELLRLYLTSYGPATVADIRWWTGWTARQAGAAIEAADTVSVDLSEGEGVLLRGDVASPVLPMPAVSFLPGLDSTPMGWKQRSWYLGDHAGPLFDRNGNVGPTVWLDGRIIGGWAQASSGEVAYRILEDVGTEAAGLVEAEANELSTWLGGTVVTPRFRAPLERQLSS